MRGDRLIAVGTNAQVDALRSARTRVIDAGGRFITPGFIDDHTHFANAGALLIGANLLDVRTAAPFAARIEAAVARMSPGAWLTGGDWGARIHPRTVPAHSRRPHRALAIGPVLLVLAGRWNWWPGSHIRSDVLLVLAGRWNWWPGSHIRSDTAD